MTNVSEPRTALKAWWRRPVRSARLRLTALCGGLFLLSGVALLAATYILFQRATRYTNPRLPKVPRTPATQHLQQLVLPAPAALAGGKRDPQLPLAVSALARDQYQLTQDQHQLLLRQPPHPISEAGPQLQQIQHQLSQDQHQMSQDQHELAQAVHQLAQAVRQVAQAGPAQAAQRAADSHQLLVNSGIALTIVAVLAILAGWLLAGRMLRPIRTITRTAQRISSTSLHERLALDDADEEFKQLGDTLDDLFGRLEAAFEAQRHFVANASHELRTPITRERTLVQVALGDPSTSDVWRSTAHELLASNREQESLIEALLTLASSESGLDHREGTDLADICHTVLPRPGRDGERLGLYVETDISSAPLDGDPRLIERLVSNLVDNAIGHNNILDGHVRVLTGVKEGRAVLSVTNTGPVVPPSEVNRLFQPFQRLDGRRTHHKNGHGLGLSIVRAIATAHGAVITASAPPGGGLSVDVMFPPPNRPETKIVSGRASRVPATSLRLG